MVENEKQDIPFIKWVRVRDAGALLCPDNPKLHDIGAVMESIARYGLQELPKLDETVGWIKAGNGRVEALMLMEFNPQYNSSPPRGLLVEKGSGAWLMPVLAGVDALNAAQAKAYLIDSNNLTMTGGNYDLSQVLQMWDAAGIGALLKELGNDDALPVSIDGDDLDNLLKTLSGGGGVDRNEHLGRLAERFGVPPFSILDSRQGYWMERKRAWIELGIQSEIGRATVKGDHFPADTMDPTTGKFERGDMRMKKRKGAMASAPEPSFYDHKRKGKEARREASREASSIHGAYDSLGSVNTDAYNRKPMTGTSIFDPVLTELAYRWFCTTGGRILDPFAGGSVRGIVAARLGYHYTGIELRPEQVDANRVQAEAITPANLPDWIIGDAADIPTLLPAAQQYDFIFSCPPYGDLEVYSDDPRDLSVMDAGRFAAAYCSIINNAVALLKPNRFACFVVGDYRNKTGHYSNFPSLTIDAFQAAGAMLYNEAIFVTPIGSLPVRVTTMFEASRKLGKTHQNVLIFYKGSPSTISRHYSAAIEYGETEPDENALGFDPLE